GALLRRGRGARLPVARVRRLAARPGSPPELTPGRERHRPPPRGRRTAARVAAALSGPEEVYPRLRLHVLVGGSGGAVGDRQHGRVVSEAVDAVAGQVDEPAVALRLHEV